MIEDQIEPLIQTPFYSTSETAEIRAEIRGQFRR